MFIELVESLRRILELEIYCPKYFLGTFLTAYQMVLPYCLKTKTL